MIEFLEEEHVYLVDGIIVTSVTTILGATIFRDKYSSIPQFVLDKAAEFGSGVHKALETKEYHDLNDLQIKCVLDYMDLIKTHEIKELAHEQLLHYNYDYAGTYDLLALYQNEEILCDIKTTSKLDMEYLSWQLSMYAYAIGFTGKLYVFWLPKPQYGKATFKEVERKSEQEILELLQEYKELSNETCSN